MNRDEAKRSEEALRRSEDYLAEAQRLTHTGSWAFAPGAHRASYWSDELFRIFGLEPGKDRPLAYEEYIRYIHPDDRHQYLTRLRQAFVEGTDYILDYRIVLPDGTVRHLHDIGHAVHDQHGGIVEFVGTSLDVTERKRIEKEQREAELRFRTFVDHATDALFVLADPGVIIDMNREACESLGYTREELLGKSPREFDPEHGGDDVFQEGIRQRIHAGEVLSFETSHRRKDGSVFPVEVRVRPFWHDDRIFALALVRDITERRRAQEEHRAHLWFLATMERMNRAIQGASDLGLALSSSLEVVLAAFGCDRALVGRYGRDPAVPSLAVLAMRERPDCATPADVPIEQELRWLAQALQSADGPVQFSLASTPPLPDAVAERLGLRSLLAMPIRPRLAGEECYLLMLGQGCSARIWTADEVRHFREIGLRLGDAIGTLSLLRTLQQSEARLEEAERIAHVGWWERDLRTNRVTISEEVRRIFGLTSEVSRQWRQQHWVELMHPDDRQRVTAAVMGVFRGSPRYDIEYRLVREGGSVRVVHSHGELRRDDSGRPVLLFGTLQDVTERRYAEQRMLAQHAVAEVLSTAASPEDAAPRILQAICQCLDWDMATTWRIDRDAGVLRFAQSWRKPSVNAPCFEAATRSCTFQPGVGLPGRVWSTRAPACVADVTQDPGFLRRDAAGSDGLHAAFAFPILLDGEVLGVFDFISRDIRHPDQELLALMAAIGSQIGQFIERKRAENELELAQTELAHMVRVTTLGELTASIAHEVNQPLAAMVTSAAACARWLAATPPQMDKARRALERIVSDGRRAGEVIARVRSLLKRQAPCREPLDINELIVETVALTSTQARRHGIAMKTRLAEGLPQVTGDRVQLQQVLLNLIVNAIEAMSPIADRRGELTIESKLDGSSLVVAVRDLGPGVDAERTAQLFEPFYTTKKEGIGMGLSITRSIIEGHGGEISAGPNDPHGAVFRFSLPLDQPAP